MIDHHAAQPCADGVAEIERADVEAGREALAGAVRLLQHPHLQRRHRCERSRAEQANEDHHGDASCTANVISPSTAASTSNEPSERCFQIAIREFAADDIADHQAAAEHQQHQRHRVLAELRELSQHAARCK